MNNIFIIIILFYVCAATLRVYRDFFSYGSGIYRHTAASRSEPSGFHSIRIIGWGEDKNNDVLTKYWVKKLTIFLLIKINQ